MKKMLCVFILVTLSLFLCACGAEEIIWNDIVLCDMLPEPPANKGEIHTNTADDLWIDINDISDKQFNDYIKACEDKGFTVDAKSDSYSYSAYNDEGYKLTLSHYSSDDEMEIQLEEPVEMSTITWPTSAAGNKLPVPKSTTGKFFYEYDDNFSVYIGNTSKTDYAEYVNACQEKGFNVDYSKGDDYYYAENNEGWSISVCYEGYNMISISIDPPTDDNDTNTSSTNSSTQTSSNQEKEPDNSGIDPDFKAAMDSYEAFMDEYVAFMKKYKANPSDFSLLTDYANYMSKYADFMEDFEKWEDEEMNAAETAYYIDVQARVSKKLLEAAE